MGRFSACSRPVTARIATLVSLIVTFYASACRHTISIPVSQVPKLVERYQTKPLVLRDGGDELHITAKHSPTLQLVLESECPPDPICRNSWWGGHVRVPLKRVRRDGNRLVIVSHSGRLADTVTIDTKAITKASLSVRHLVPKGWDPTWGIGVSIAGPSGIGGLTLQHLPVGWLAIEGGAFLAVGIASAWSGFRLRGPRVSLLRPFVGGFALGVSASHAPERSKTAAFGSRLGLDMVFPGFLVTVEANAMSTRDAPTKTRRWRPWGGVTLSWVM